MQLARLVVSKSFIHSTTRRPLPETSEATWEPFLLVSKAKYKKSVSLVEQWRALARSSVDVRVDNERLC